MNRALLVGINAYPGQPLNGCVNDVQDMASYIEASRGFGRGDIHLLTDTAATTVAIKSELEWLLRDAGNGDRLLFHYSGHGTTMPTPQRAVVDAICPADFDFTPQHALTAMDFA